MATVGQHLTYVVEQLVALRVAVEALTAELQAVRAELAAINGKTPSLVNGKVPATVTADGALAVTTTQLPATLSNGKVKVTGLL